MQFVVKKLNLPLFGGLLATVLGLGSILHFLIPESHGGLLKAETTAATATPVAATSSNTAHGASQRLVRIWQRDRNQYASDSEFYTWSPSTCSTTSMTEIFNAYGKQVRIADVLKVQSDLKKIDSALGLLGTDGISMTAAHFGFRVLHDTNLSVNDLVGIANSGAPVMVGWTTAEFPGGHWLVVTGGDSEQVRVADSSGLNYQAVTRGQFTLWWDGAYAIPVPQEQEGMPAGMPSSAWVQVAYNHAVNQELNPTYFVKQINRESGYNRSALSPAGAQGIAQFMPGTAAEMGIDPWNPTQALDGAARLMKSHYQKYLALSAQNQAEAYRKAFAAYNCGGGCVDSTLARGGTNWFALLPTETRSYVEYIMG